MITITPFTPIGSDPRGDTLAFQVKDYGQFVFLTRKQGSLSGNTYHKGLNIGTRLKTFVLLEGRALINYRNVDSSEVHQIEVPPRSVVQIEPFVVHNMLAQTDIMLLENNAISDIKADVVREQVAITAD